MGNKFTSFDAGAAAGPGAPAMNRVDANPGAEARSAGAAIADFGVQLAQAKKRTDDRNDTVNRSRAYNEYNRLATDEALRLETEGDVTDPTLTQKYGSFLQENMQKQLDNHVGSPESLARLTIRLESIRANAASRMARKVTLAGRETVRKGLSTNLTAIAEDAAQTGDLTDAFKRVDDEVKEAAQALTPAEEEANRQSGRAAVLTRVFDEHLENSNTEAARNLLEFPNLATIVGDKEHRRMRREVIKIDRAEQKGVQEAEQEIAKYMTIMNIKKKEDLTDVDRKVIANFNPRQTAEQKYAEWIAGYNKAGLPEPSAETKERFLNGFNQADSTRRFTEAGSRGVAARLGPKILTGEASEQDVVDFIAATTVLDRTSTKIAADGSVVTIPGVLSQTTKNALNELGVNSRGESITPSDQPGPNHSTDTAQGGPVVEGGKPSLLSPNSKPIPFEETVFGASFYGTGLLSTIKNIGAGVPILGETEFFRNEKVVKARERLVLYQNELVSVLRTGERADKERIEIKEETSIGPKDIESPQRFRDRLASIDEVLEVRAIKALKRANSKEVMPEEQRKELRAFSIKASIFRDKLAVPKDYDSFEDARKSGIQPGTIIRIQGQYVEYQGSQR
jgi:hypothetical protein